MKKILGCSKPSGTAFGNRVSSCCKLAGRENAWINTGKCNELLCVMV